VGVNLSNVQEKSKQYLRVYPYKTNKKEETWQTFKKIK